jgi:hypothetical protein
MAVRVVVLGTARHVHSHAFSERSADKHGANHQNQQACACRPHLSYRLQSTAPRTSYATKQISIEEIDFADPFCRVPEYDVLPFVSFDYLSYSAWESINTADPASTLVADLNTIQEVVGFSASILGEAGCARQNNSGAVVARVSEVISTALAWGVAYVIHWQLYDADAVNAFGLYDLDGQPTLLANWFQRRFQQTGEAQRPCVYFYRDPKRRSLQ